MVFISPSHLRLNSDDFAFFETFLAPLEAEIGLEKDKSSSIKIVIVRGECQEGCILPVGIAWLGPWRPWLKAGGGGVPTVITS